MVYAKPISVEWARLWCSFYSPSNGESACGVLSWKISMKTENANRIAIPRDIFSPESTGTMKLSADNLAKALKSNQIKSSLFLIST